MSPAWIICLTFAVAALLAGVAAYACYDLFFRYRALLKDRLSEVSGETASNGTALVVDFKQIAAQASQAPGNWRSRLRDFVEQADLHVGLRVLVVISAGLGIAVSILLAVISSTAWIAPLGLLVGPVAFIGYVYSKRARRMRKMTWQLPEVFDVIGRGVRAGQTVPAAFQTVADEFDPPICNEFRHCYEQQNLGMSYDAALRDLARRTPMMELRILVVALLVQSRSGGNLSTLLGNLSAMVRKRLKMQQRVKSLTGEGRLQAAILIVLPVLAFFALLIVAPDYAASLIERPWLLAMTGLAELIGAIWIRQIVRFEV
jgi:tight adherence protein B